MEKSFLSNKIQKYFPYILVALTILLGGYISFQKGIIGLPKLGNKDSIVNLGPGSTVDIFFTGGEYKLSYSGINPSYSAKIASFDKTEQWQGSGGLDRSDESIGGTILSVVDRDRQGATSYMLKNLDLSQIDNIKLTVNLKTDQDDLEALNLILGNKDSTSYYRFPITNLIKGINYISIPKYRFILNENTTSDKRRQEDKTTPEIITKSAVSWDKIERVQFDLFSRPNSRANVEIGWVSGEKDDLFSSEWNWDNLEHFFNLDVGIDGKPILLLKNIGKGIATFKKVGSVRDFTYSAKITSLKRGPIGIFFRGDYKTGLGYYVTTGGVGTSEWTIHKFGLDNNKPKTTILMRGQIGNFEFNHDKPFWLKTIVKSSNITAYFSLDGKSWTKLGGVTDSEFNTGGVGVTTNGGGIGYFDEFNLSI